MVNFIKWLFGEIAARLVVVFLGLLIAIIGLISPGRCLYAVYSIADEGKKNICSSC